MTKFEEQDPVDHWVARAAPAVHGRDDIELEHAFTALAERITASPYRPRTRARRAATLALVAVVAAATPAAASWVSARTGLFGDGRSTETDDSEFLRSESPEIAALVARHVAVTDLPPGTTRQEAAQAVTRRLARNPALVQETTIRQLVAWDAGCRWERAWLVAVDNGDHAAQARAVDGIQRAAPWFAATATAAARGDRAAVQAEYTVNCPQDMQ